MLHFTEKFLEHFRLAKRIPVEQIRRSAHVEWAPLAATLATRAASSLVSKKKKQIETDVLGPRADTLSHTDTIENMSNGDT